QRWRTILLTVLNRDHVTRGTSAIHWGRRAHAHAVGVHVVLPIRGASAGIGWRRRRGRRVNAATARADVVVRTVAVGGARQEPLRTRIAGTESHAGLACITADLVLVAVVDHHLEAIVVTDFQSDV